MAINTWTIRYALLRLGCNPGDLVDFDWDQINVSSEAMTRLLGRSVGKTTIMHYGRPKFFAFYGEAEMQNPPNICLIGKDVLVVRVADVDANNALYDAISQFAEEKLAPELQPAWRRWIRRWWNEICDEFTTSASIFRS